MSAYSITISSGGTTATIQENGKFTLDAVRKVTDNGKIEFVDVVVKIVGDVATSPPDALQTAVKALYDLVASNFQLATVSIKLDGVEKWAFSPSTCFGSPHVMVFRTLGADGDGNGRWRYELEIFARVKGNQFGGVYELSSSVLTRTEYGTVVRKVWRATCRSGTASSAMQTVMRFKPGIPDDDLAVVEEEEFAQEARATGLWEWKATRNKKVLQIEEDVYVTPPASRYLSDEQGTKDGFPRAIKGRIAAGIGRVTGVVTGLEKSIQAPKPHWVETKTQIRQRSEEKTYQPIYDEEKRVWRLKYEESWIFFDIPSVPRHIDHNNETIKLPPGDGVAGSL